MVSPPRNFIGKINYIQNVNKTRLKMWTFFRILYIPRSVFVVVIFGPELHRKIGTVHRRKLSF